MRDEVENRVCLLQTAEAGDQEGDITCGGCGGYGKCGGLCASVRQMRRLFPVLQGRHGGDSQWTCARGVGFEDGCRELVKAVVLLLTTRGQCCAEAVAPCAHVRHILLFV
jgi:hypothetical protein